MQTADISTAKSTTFNCIFSSNVIPLHFLYSDTPQIEIEAQCAKAAFFIDFYRTLGCQIDEYTRLFGTKET